MPNLLTLISVGVHVRSCQNDGCLKVGTLGKITDILLWTDDPINTPPRIFIDWYDENGDVFYSGGWTMKDFCPHGGKIASMGHCDKTQEDWIKYNRNLLSECKKPLW